MHGHHRRFRGMTVEAMRAAAAAMEAAGETGGENGGRATTRVQLEMPPQAMERLQKLKDRTEAASYAEVIRNALRLFEA
ncbi:MAG TPA: ribbon-helix-helix protein, CopG family, partial [Rhizomicrobium sp.]